MGLKAIAAGVITGLCASGLSFGDGVQPDSLGAFEKLQAQRAAEKFDAIEPADVEKAKSGEEVRTNVFPIVKVRKDDRHEHVKILPVIVGEAYSYSRHGEHSETEILDVPFASLVEREEHGPGKQELRVGNLPFTTMLEAESDGDARSLKLVDVPLFTLLDNEDKGDGRFDNKLLKLPIVGSLFRHKRTADKEKIRFLIFSHTRHFDSDDARTPGEHGRSRNARKFGTRY